MPKTKACKIEVATLDDIFELTVLAREAYSEDIIDKESFKFSTKKIGMLLSHTIPSSEFLVLCLRDEKEIVGYFFAAISECFYSLETQTLCLSWFVRPEHRSIRNVFSLLNSYEKWAKESGAVVINMIDVKDRAFKVFEKLGYKISETVYVKGVS